MHRSAALLVRQPLLLLLILGCTASVLTSGFFTLRLIVDGAVSFAFVAVCEAAGVAAVWLRRRSGSYPLAVDQLFANNLPWLLWLVGLTAVGAFVPVLVQFGGLIAPVLLSALVPIGCAAWLDFHSFRSTDRSVGGAASDVLLLRAVAWPLACMYFFGAVFLSDIAPGIAEALGP